jgi:hypothetical protein
MNDFDVVTGPSPGSVAAKIAPPVPSGEVGKRDGERGAAVPPSPPSPSRGEGESKRICGE